MCKTQVLRVNEDVRARSARLDVHRYGQAAMNVPHILFSKDLVLNFRS